VDGSVRPNQVEAKYKLSVEFITTLNKILIINTGCGLVVILRENIYDGIG
jgi:hypothetical protein